jgi:hypothetical protein
LCLTCRRCHLLQVLERWILHELKQLIIASSEPLATANLQRTRGRLLYYLGHYDDAAQDLDECVSALRTLLSSEHSDTVFASRLLAESLRRGARHNDPIFCRNLEIQEFFAVLSI